MLECCTEVPDAHLTREGRVRLRSTLCRAHFRKNLHSEDYFHETARQALGRRSRRPLDDGRLGISRRKAEWRGWRGLFRAQLSIAILKNLDTARRDYLVPFRGLILASLFHCSDCLSDLTRTPKSSRVL